MKKYFALLIAFTSIVAQAGGPIIWGANGALNLKGGGIQMQSGQFLYNNGPKNYLTNPLAESGLTTGWSLGTVALTSGLPTGTPTFGSGASGNLSLSATSTTPLQGSYSFSYVSSAATTAGNFIASDAFTVDASDLGKPITVQFYYQPTSGGSNANWSGTSSNSFGIAIYDVTAGGANWIVPAGVWGMTQGSGAGIATATFQTSTTSGQQYRVVVYNANATSGAITTYFDQLLAGPQTAPIGPVVTDWVAYTPTITGGGTVSGVNFVSRRVGANLEVQGALTLGTTTATEFRISLGYGGGNSNVTTSSALPTLSVAGTFVYSAVGADAHNALMEASKTYMTVGVASSGTASLAKVNGNWFTSSTTVAVYASFPIAGWSSNVQMSNDTDTRVVAASVGMTSAYVPGGVNVVTKYDTVVKDTHAAYSTSTGIYTVPVTGFYRISVVSVSNTTSNLYVKINSTSLTRLSGTNAETNSGTVTVFANAGDALGIYSDQNQTFSAASGGVYLNYASFVRESGPSVIAATDSVNARYFASATSISGSLATVVWTTKDFDNTNSMSSGVYTIPVSGKYQVNAAVATAATYALNNQLVLEIQKNSTVVSRVKNYAAAAVTDLSAEASDIISAVAGDTIRVQVSSAGTSPTIVSSNFENYFSIAKVGN